MKLRLLLGCALVVLGCDAVLGPDPPASNASLFDLVWSDLDRHYAFFESKQLDWRQRREVYRPQALAATSAPQLAQVIAAMFDELADIHVTLYTPGKRYQYAGYDARPFFFDTRLIFAAGYVSRSVVTRSGNVRHGEIGGTLLYVWIPSFGGTEWAADLDAVLDAHPGVAGVIIDIRNNGGGNNQTAREIAGRFVDSKRLSSYSRFRSGPGHGDFTEPYPSYITRQGRRHFDGPVALLTSRHNWSAAEDFVLAMRLLPKVTVVGDSTGGGMGYPVFRELPNGWTYRFSEGLTVDHQMRLLEGIGIAPDVFVRQTQSDSASGYDTVLDKACEVLGVPRCSRP